MMEIDKETQKIIDRLTALRDQTRYYGLILGVALVLIDLFQYAMRSHISVASASVILLVKVSALFLITHFILQKLKTDNFNSKISFAQSFSIVIKLFLYASLLSGIFSFVLNKWIAPDYLSEVLTNSITTLKNYISQRDLTSSQLSIFNDYIKKIEESPVPTPLTAMWSQIWSYILWGTFIGAVLSFFSRNKSVRPLANYNKTQQS